MTAYLIRTPEGNHTVLAETLYHAIQIVVERTSYKFTNSQLLRLNGTR